jgi:acetolactate synthase small subunit
LSEEEKRWIQGAIKHPGALHRALGVKQGEKIPAKKLKVKPSDSPKLKRMKILAKTLKKLRHKGKKS